MGLVLFCLLGIGLIFYYVKKKNKEFKIIPKPITIEQEQLIVKHFYLFNKLNPALKSHFLKRVGFFINNKQFIPRNIPTVSIVMKTLIAATAVQLTFGLPKVYLKHFRYILIYPDSYYSTITRQYHKGEVNPRHQAIVLSWQAFEAGFASREGVNLAFHEMAHALKLENRIRNEEFDFLPKEELEIWDSLARVEIEKMKDDRYESFFRKYGSIDLDEFFAVAVENFFERPEQFLTQKPEFYYILAKILNQDPLHL